jgi:hypothetical protein
VTQITLVVYFEDIQRRTRRGPDFLLSNNGSGWQKSCFSGWSAVLPEVFPVSKLPVIPTTHSNFPGGFNDLAKEFRHSCRIDLHSLGGMGRAGCDEYPSLCEYNHGRGAHCGFHLALRGR